MLLNLVQILPWWLRGLSVCPQCGRPGFDPRVGKIPWRKKWQLTPVLLPGESHGRKSLAGYSPRGRKQSDTTEPLHLLTYAPITALQPLIPPALFWFECWSEESVLETFLFGFLHSIHLDPFVDLSGEICIISTSVHYFTRNNTTDRHEQPSGFRPLVSLKGLGRPCLRLPLCPHI